MTIELLVGRGVDQRRITMQLPGVPRVGDTVADRDGNVNFGTVYAVIWLADTDDVQVRVD